VPAVGEWLGVFSPSYLFEAGRLVILPQLAELPSLATNTTLLFSSLAMVIGASFLIALNRRALIDAERRLMLQTWALRQLVPSEARASSTS
jgi:hypothetical protein